MSADPLTEAPEPPQILAHHRDSLTASPGLQAVAYRAGISGAPMKYYIYLSRSKLSMLHAQVVQSAERARLASPELDAQTLTPQNSLTQLNEVIKRLHELELVGNIDHPKAYIAETLPMTWCTYGDTEESPITFWGYCELQDQFTGTVLALAGSKHHLLGQQPKGLTHSISHSLTPVMVRWFLENLDDPFEDIDMLRLKQTATGDFLKHPVAHAAWLAATQGTGIDGTYEFIAKLLYWGDWPYGSRGETRKILLGSPLYVAMAE
jgi:hypothetical protein